MTNKTDKNSNATRSGAQSKIEQLTTDTNAKTTSSRGSAYQQITERIIALLKQGTVPWHKPWNAQTGMPRNLITGRPYRGVNVFLLLAMSYESPFWLTFRQVKELGGSVRKGEKSCPIVYWRQNTVEDENGEEQKFSLLRFYHVFNVAQCEGLKDAEVATPLPTSDIVGPAVIVAKMPTTPVVRHGMTRAYYSPVEDLVAMPKRERFENEDEFFSTLFHELIHSTGHQTRLNRPTLTENPGFGSNSYCKEELIAEIGAAFLCAHAGIVDRTVDNSAAYLQGWLAQLRNDKTLIIKAAAQAQKAADYILGMRIPDSSGNTESAME